jgi:hypothetical protein
MGSTIWRVVTGRRVQPQRTTIGATTTADITAETTTTTDTTDTSENART